MSVSRTVKGRPVRALRSTVRLARWIAGGASAAALALGASCGARTELDLPPQMPPEPECDVDEDCPGFDDLCDPITCVDTALHADELPEVPEGQLLPPRVCYGLQPVDCDDEDVCTEDLCEQLTGQCSWTPSTFDLDGDGHHAFRPGTEPGTPEACGDDCDDSDEHAFPGNVEVCDGVDNDCNGIIDDNATYIPLMDEPVRISGNIAPAEPGGLGFSGESYLSIYMGTSDGFDMYETRLDPYGVKVEPIEQPVALQNADSYGGPLVWIGDRYGLTWEDRRDSDYEIYFALMDWMGQKSIPDVRLTNAYGFSVNVDLAWNGTEFIVAWQDERNGLFEVMAQRVSVDGVPLGGNVTLSPPEGFDDESPSVAVGTGGLGLAFTNGQPGYHVVRFGLFDQTTLAPLVPVFDLTDGSTESVYPTVEWNQDEYIVAWYDRSGPVKAIFASTVAPDGTVLVPPTAVTSPGSANSRYQQIIPLGDRTLVLYADDRDGNDGYELYMRMVHKDLSPLGEEQRLTDAPHDSISPVGVFGPEGDLGILFRDDRDGGNHHVWFMRVGCMTAPTP